MDGARVKPGEACARSASAEHTLHLQPEPGAQSATRIQLADCVTGRVVKVEAIVMFLYLYYLIIICHI